MYNKAIKIEEHKTSTKEIRVATQENTQAERQKGNVMKNLFAVNFAENAIVGSQSAVKKAGRVGSKEYKMLMELLEKHPTFKVVELAEGEEFELGFNGSCVGLRKSDTELLDQVNAALDLLSEEQRAEILAGANERQPK